MQNESIIICQIEETIKQTNPRPLGFSIETIRFTKLVGKVNTTHVLVVCRQKGWDILVSKSAIRLQSWHLVGHCLQKYIAKETNYFAIMESVINNITRFE